MDCIPPHDQWLQQQAGRFDISTCLPVDDRTRRFVITSALMALFLGAMDGLIITAAMPTIVADLGGLHLYSWAYSIPLLSRAVTLPLFGKLADLYSNKRLFIIALTIFLLASLAAGLSPNMSWLITARAIQGIGAGGIFALIFIVLAEMSAPEQRARTMALESVAWGVASVIGPTLGALIVTYFSWRWIFFLELPLGLIPMVGIAFFFVETREKRPNVAFDIKGLLTLSVCILSMLTLFMIGGQQRAWLSWEVMSLAMLTLIFAGVFYQIEKQATEPIISMALFRNPGFSLTSAAVFVINFSMFALFAYSPVFLQGTLGHTPLQVGWAMLSLSLGWSLGTVILGQIANKMGVKNAAVIGSIIVTTSCAPILFFDTATTLNIILPVFLVIGLGVGFVTLANLLASQNTVDPRDMGVATGAFQFARTVGGTIGIGICGSVLNLRMTPALERIRSAIAAGQDGEGLGQFATGGMEKILESQFQTQLNPAMLTMLKTVILNSVTPVFWIIVITTVLCLGLSMALPRERV